MVKKILAILCCACLFVPEAARIIAANVCTYIVMDKGADPVCACTFNVAPSDNMQQPSMPSRHKEIVQQTDWQYTAAEKIHYHFGLIHTLQHTLGFYNNHYSSSFINSIFHPPCAC